MAGKSSALKLVAELLEADFVAFTGRSNACRLCNLPKDQADALELICRKRKETTRPTIDGAIMILARIGVKTSVTSLRDHYRKHWDGEKPAANRS